MIRLVIFNSLQASKFSKQMSVNNLHRLHNIQRYTFLDQKIFSQDHYKILGVQPGTSKDEIKKQYYKLTKLYHPDINKGNEEKFKQINASWDVLGDDQKRKEYDAYNGFFGHSNSSSSSSSTQGAQGFNPFGGFGSNQFGGPNPFHSSGQGQNPFGAGSPFENVDLDQLLKDLKKNGVKLEDIQKNPHFNEFNQMFGLNNEEPKNLKDKIKLKAKQEAIKFMLRRVQDKLEKDIQFHKEQKEKYQQQAAGYSTQSRSTNQYQNTYQSSQQNNNQKNEFDPFQGFQRNNQSYYANKPGSNKTQNSSQSGSSSKVSDSLNKASEMFSQFFKKK